MPDPGMLMTSKSLLLAATLAFAALLMGSLHASAEPDRAPLPAWESYKLIAEREAEKAGLPAGIADAVMAIESGYDPERIGGVGEVGLMQVRPGTAALMGFKGTARELADPATNIHFGVIYLASAWRRANGDLCRALMKYRAGHDEETMSFLSASYCSRARAHLASREAGLTAVGTRMYVPAVGRKTVAAGGLPPRLNGAAFWAARKVFILRQNADIERRWRLRALEAQVSRF